MTCRLVQDKGSGPIDERARVEGVSAIAEFKRGTASHGEGRRVGGAASGQLQGPGLHADGPLLSSAALNVLVPVPVDFRRVPRLMTTPVPEMLESFCRSNVVVADTVRRPPSVSVPPVNVKLVQPMVLLPAAIKVPLARLTVPGPLTTTLELKISRPPLNWRVVPLWTVKVPVDVPPPSSTSVVPGPWNAKLLLSTSTRPLLLTVGVTIIVTAWKPVCARPPAVNVPRLLNVPTPARSIKPLRFEVIFQVAWLLLLMTGSLVKMSVALFWLTVPKLLGACRECHYQPGVRSPGGSSRLCRSWCRRPKWSRP